MQIVGSSKAGKVDICCILEMFEGRKLYLWFFECFIHKLIVLVERQYYIDDSPLSHFALHK